MKTGNPCWRVIGLFFAAFIISNIALDHFAPTQRSVNAENVRAKAVVPDGWRRTRDGWEHTSTWTNALANLSINELIQRQRRREPAWIRFGFAKLRSIPPLMVAVLQVSAIAVIVNVSQSRRKELDR